MRLGDVLAVKLGAALFYVAESPAELGPGIRWDGEACEACGGYGFHVRGRGTRARLVCDGGSDGFLDGCGATFPVVCAPADAVTA